MVILETLRSRTTAALVALAAIRLQISASPPFFFNPIDSSSFCSVDTRSLPVFDELQLNIGELTQDRDDHSSHAPHALSGLLRSIGGSSIVLVKMNALAR
ncbi:hypothetical protein [Brucella pseudogrignonensis]|uniref:hypothetical protein n=1 Tax=Brucella pseudogrignonensis TaxID=419475 RepID=UPI0038D0C2B6